MAKNNTHTYSDKFISGLSRRYGLALYLSAQEEKSTSKLMAEAAELKTWLNHEIENFLASPAYSHGAKKGAMSDILKQIKASALLTRFVLLVLQKGRGEFLAEMLTAVEMLNAEDKGVVSASVVSATTLTSTQKKEVEAFVKKTDPTMKKVNLTAYVDKSLVAGLKIQIGAVEYDSSLSSRLGQLAQSLQQQIVAE